MGYAVSQHTCRLRSSNNLLPCALCLVRHKAVKKLLVVVGELGV